MTHTPSLRIGGLDWVPSCLFWPSVRGEAGGEGRRDLETRGSDGCERVRSTEYRLQLVVGTWGRRLLVETAWIHRRKGAVGTRKQTDDSRTSQASMTETWFNAHYYDNGSVYKVPEEGVWLEQRSWQLQDFLRYFNNVGAGRKMTNSSVLKETCAALSATLRCA